MAKYGIETAELKDCQDSLANRQHGHHMTEHPGRHLAQRQACKGGHLAARQTVLLSLLLLAALGQCPWPAAALELGTDAPPRVGLSATDLAQLIQRLHRNRRDSQQPGGSGTGQDHQIEPKLKSFIIYKRKF